MDAAQFSAFYAGAQPRVVRAVYALTGDAGEAQDAAQEAFVRAWDHRRVLRSDGNPEAWVTTTALRIAVSRWRRAGTTARAMARVGAGEDATGPCSGGWRCGVLGCASSPSSGSSDGGCGWSSSFKHWWGSASFSTSTGRS